MTFLGILGRKALLVISLMIGGLGCLSTVFTIMYAGPEYAISTTVMAMIGKFGVGSAFSTVFVYTGELYPTTVRNSAMGTSSMMGRVGGMLAPYIADLDRLVGGSFGKALPQVVLGTLAILASLLSLSLPETLRKNLPETIEQCKHLDMKVDDVQNKSETQRSLTDNTFDDTDENTEL